MLPAGAHLSLAAFTNGSECARDIATEFLALPTASLDTSCVHDLPRVDYTPRDRSRQIAAVPRWGRTGPAWQPNR